MARATREHSFVDRLRCAGLADSRPLGCGAAPTRHQPLAHLRCDQQELAQGCRDKTELARLKKGLAARNTEVLPLTPTISGSAVDLIDSLALSHGMRLADALIASTAIEHELTLLSANAKHFGTVGRLQLEAFVP